MGFANNNHLPTASAEKPTGNHLADFLRVKDWDTVYRRIKNFKSDNWTDANKPRIEKNTPLSTNELSLLRDIYGADTINEFLKKHTKSTPSVVATLTNADDRLKEQADKHRRALDRAAAEKQQIEEAYQRHKAAAEADRTRLEAQHRTQTDYLNRRIADLEKLANSTKTTETATLKAAEATTRAAMQGEVERLKAQNAALHTKLNDLTTAQTDREQQIEAAAEARAEAAYLRDSENLVEQRVKARLHQQAQTHKNELRDANQRFTNADTEHKRALAELQATNDQLRGRLQAAETRLKTEWGKWRVPTRLEIPPIMSLILAAVGLGKMLGLFGIGIFIMLACVYSEAMGIVKNPKYQNAVRWLLATVAAFEVLFLALHPTTVKLIMEETLGDKLDKLTFSVEQTAWGFSVLISALAVLCIWINWKKTQDAAKL